MKRWSDWVHLVLLLICCFVAATTSWGCTTIVVKNQAEFDELQEKLTTVIKARKKNIHIKLLPGTYIAKEKHLTLNGITAIDTKIHIKGKDAILIPEGREYHDGEVYQGTFSPDNSWMNGIKDVETWSYIRYADGLVEVLDTVENYCRIICKEAFADNTDFSNAFILIPHWYQSSVYKINKIDGRYIYFIADDLKKSSYGGYNINDDYNYGKKDIRYKLCNVATNANCISVVDEKVHLPDGVTAVWEGKIHNFLTIKNCKFSSVEITGIQFTGNAYSKSNPAIYFKDSEFKSVRIHRCGFYGMRGNVISITASSNVSIDNCQFENCYYFGIKSNNESANTTVKKNRFTSMGKRMSNTPCVRCQGSDYRVSDNVFLNFGYGGISTGVWYKSKMKQPCAGVIENNDLSFDQDYLNHIDNYGIMDGGAIYVATKNAGSIVRYNYIHGFSGMKSNRGIFCDDGAYNIEIYGNAITNIANSRCIDSRRVTKVEQSNFPKSDIDRANVNIIIRDNIVDGSIRFEAHESPDNGCVKGVNYILPAKDGSTPRMIVDHVADQKEDVLLDASTSIKKTRKKLKLKK